MAPIISRGFRGRRAADVDPARVPPGQYMTQDFPVLSAGPTPHTALESWDFSIAGELAQPRGWTWEEFRALPSEGQPLAPEHGGPARLLVPQHYFWKSAKWVRGLRLQPADEPGFWETNGYHNYGDPWQEQRYAGD
jgi:DMSO/TMAO reductase YedYZ molybdopterin-dependent catalytic subunit